ncbi:MAG: DUF493 domain-containing protein [Desulfobulbaceae bacterium]|uniref:DUF493 domain-containing protein n=1 Tax=Candidatus Desulfatifera sulfidica TaxID=2841691 RepID=A0A8J6TDK8_9BACT|nr:DUF493 domain-containing protein [Candidatus Desulfatifera sulfidica]
MTLDPFPKPFCSQQRPEINYPCTWLYKVIGQDADAIHRAVAAVCPRKPLSITLSHTSSGGKYCSLNVELEVKNDEERLGFYENLKNHNAVRTVL